MQRQRSAPKRLELMGTAAAAVDAADAGAALELAACSVAAAMMARTTPRRIRPCRRTRATLECMSSPQMGIQMRRGFLVGDLTLSARSLPTPAAAPWLT